jgi:hypothetical protein
MPIHAIALFADRHAAHAAVEQLVQAAFTRDAIGIVMTEDTYEREFAAPVSDGAAARPNRTGVLSAIVVGLAVLTRPGGLALRAAGPLVVAMLEAGEGWSVSAALVSAGLDEHEARLLDEGVRGGSIAVSVEAVSDRAALAQKLLELSGGAALQAA